MLSQQITKEITTKFPESQSETKMGTPRVTPYVKVDLSYDQHLMNVLTNSMDIVENLITHLKRVIVRTIQRNERNKFLTII